MDKSVNTLPLISVILPVKDGEKYLAQSIESVMNQDFDSIELIVIDGHSSDETANIAKEYPQIKYYLQEGTGVANAWNQGISLSTGEYIAFQACDDLWMPNKLPQQFQALQKSKDTGYVIGMIRFQLEEDQLPPPGFRTELLNGTHVGRTLENMLVRKSVFDRIGAFDEELDTAHDVEWFLRCKDGGVNNTILPELFLTKIIHQRNATFTVHPELGKKALLNIFRQSILTQRKKDDTKT